MTIDISKYFTDIILRYEYNLLDTKTQLEDLFYYRDNSSEKYLRLYLNSGNQYQSHEVYLIGKRGLWIGLNDDPDVFTFRLNKKPPFNQNIIVNANYYNKKWKVKF